MMADIRVIFTEAMADGFFASLRNGVRKSTEEHLNVPAPDGENYAEKTIVTPNGDIGSAVALEAPNNGGSIVVGFGSLPDGTVRLKLNIEARNMKALAALVDLATAGLVGLDGISLVQEWARR